MSLKPKAISREQRNLWRKLNEYIRQEGGWTVSQPDSSPIRFEAALNSELPELLRQAGHRVIDYGRHERLYTDCYHRDPWQYQNHPHDC